MRPESVATHSDSALLHLTTPTVFQSPTPSRGYRKSITELLDRVGRANEGGGQENHSGGRVRAGHPKDEVRSRTKEGDETETVAPPPLGEA